MRLDRNQINRVAPDLLQLKPQIACRYCRDTVGGRSSRTVLDDSGSVSITAWTCARCGAVIEEIRILAQDGQARPRPIRYTVAPLRSTGRSAPIAHRDLRS